MVQIAQKKLKNQKGFTLIELLAVIVILGIIAAIAIPSILGLINNSKKDAQVANAQQMVSAARNVVASNDSILSWSTTDNTTYTATVKLSQLTSAGYLESFTNPNDSTGYNTDTSVVLITKTGNNLSYTVTLQGKTDTTKYFDQADSTLLKRVNVGVAQSDLK